MTLEAYGVVGNPIDHSLSPQIHLAFANSIQKIIRYDRFCVTSDFETQIRLFFEKGGRGLNITAPFKVQAFEMSEVKTPRCQQALSANVLWMENGLLHADNTDGIGLCRALEKQKTLTDARVLILGAGGAVRGIIPALLEKSVTITITNRTLKKAEALCQQFPGTHLLQDASELSFDILIHAAHHSSTSLTWSSVWLQNRPYCYDLTYSNDGKTPFTTWANVHGCLSSDGFSMLVEQAREAFTMWHKIQPQIQIERLNY